MPCQGQWQIFGWDSAAIVNDTDQPFTALGHTNRDPPRASVDGILHQLLDRRGWTLNHFARRDPVDRAIVKTTNSRRRIAYIGVWCVHSTIYSIGN